MAGKAKKIITDTTKLTLAPVAAALQVKFPQFQFKVDVDAVVAEGPWDQPASARPAMGTMACYAEGYMQALVDNASVSAQRDEARSGNH